MNADLLSAELALIGLNRRLKMTSDAFVPRWNVLNASFETLFGEESEKNALYK